MGNSGGMIYILRNCQTLGAQPSKVERVVTVSLDPDDLAVLYIDLGTTAAVRTAAGRPKGGNNSIFGFRHKPSPFQNL
jgi:hypothetical protein